MDKQILIDGQAAGKSLRTIAKDQGIGFSTAIYWSRKYGIAFTGKGGKPPVKEQKQCRLCGKKISRANTFCSSDCSTRFVSSEIVKDWLDGKIDGHDKSLTIRNAVRQYLYKQSNYACSECGYKDVHPLTKEPILTIHHKDGDASNSKPDNLQVLCWNCHAKTENWGMKNKGNGKRLV